MGNPTKPKPMGTKFTPPVAFRCSTADRRAFNAAAKHVGLPLSDWLRMIARQAAGL